MSKLRHEESGKFNDVPTRTVKTIPYSGPEHTKIKDIRQGNEMGAIVKMDFTGDSASPNSPVRNDLGTDTSLGNNVGVLRDLRDGNSAPSTGVNNLPPRSDLRKRNNKSWDMQR